MSIGFTGISYGDKIEAPRKQLEKGATYNEIICKAGHTLVLLKTQKIACLSAPTFLKLDERDYVKSVIRVFEENLVEIKDDIQTQNSERGTTVSGDVGQTSIPQITNIPASGGSIVNFYITDDDLNTSPNGIDIIETKDLVEFLINGIPVEGSDTMIETGPNTGQFYVKLKLPESVNGKPISQDDIIEIRYIDQSDVGGDKRISTKSIPLSKTYAQIQTSGGGTRIGHEFVVRIYEPDANLDSRDVDRISLSRLEYRGEGGIRTTLSNPLFDANSSHMLETGENTGIFAVTIKIPRTLDGKTVHIGDWYEIRYIDTTTPSNTSEEIKLKGKIG